MNMSSATSHSTSAKVDKIVGESLMDCFPHGKKVGLVNKDGKIIIQSSLKENEFEYIMSKTLYNCNNVSNNGVLSIALYTTSNNGILPAYYFYDADNNKIVSKVIKANRNEYIEVPKEARFVRFALRVSAREEEEIKGIFFQPVDMISTNVVKKNGATCRFIVNNLKYKNNGVVIFFASARTNYNRYPVYSRHTWHKYLPSLCSISVADPYELDPDCAESHGSWYIGKDGKSSLPIIADCIKEILGSEHGPIITYGSSMGGYASILCGYYIKSDAIVAECPQIDLTTYHYANIRLSKLKYIDENIINIFNFWKNNTFSGIFLFCKRCSFYTVL